MHITRNLAEKVGRVRQAVHVVIGTVCTVVYLSLHCRPVQWNAQEGDGDVHPASG